jgi:hypothetical protein
VEKAIHHRKRETKGPGLAQGFMCYWAVAELGMSMVDLARKLDMTPAAVSYAVQRGEKMVKKRGYQLESWVI